MWIPTTDDQVNWLLEHYGVPGEEEEDILTDYSVEYILEGGGYVSTMMKANSLAALIEGIISEEKKAVGRIIIDPIYKGKERDFHLLNSPRLD